MKKTMMFIVFFGVLLISISAYSEKVFDVNKGYFVPSLILENKQEKISLEELKGKYVLLSFWSSTNAISRVVCNEYSTFAKKASNNEQFCLLSVNFDSSKRLFREIVRRDNLSTKAQFNVQGEHAEKIKKTFHLEDGYNSLLIDPSGRVIATNPSTETLTKILSL